MDAWGLPGYLKGGEGTRLKARTNGASHADLGFTALPGKVAMILRRRQSQGWETEVPPNTLQESAGDSDPSRPQSGFLREGVE